MELILSTGERLTLEAARKEERDVLHRLRNCERRSRMYSNLWVQRAQIQTIIARHLGLRSSTQCVVQSPAEWNRGQFNICVHVLVTDNRNEISRKIFRCPMPHKVGHQDAPAAIDEKIRSEAANYAWIEQNCPDIPIPKLIGFGLFNGEQFTHQRNLPWYRRLGLQICRFVRSMFCKQHFSPYSPQRSRSQLDTGYILIDYIDKNTGTMLGDVWQEEKHNEEKKERLYYGLSQIMLSLARQPQSRIGSLRFNEDGSISLANRPLLCTNSILENEGAPRMEGLYSSTGQYLLALQDFRATAFASQPNAVNDEEDCRLQMAYMVLLRSIVPKVFNLQYSGPFVLQHTDLHAGNIFVDADWNITGIIDLEFICSLPPEMQQVPYRLCVDFIDEISEHQDEFTKMYNSFLRTFATGEKEQNGYHLSPLADAMHQVLRSGAYWVYHCLTSINAMPFIIEQHIYPIFGFRLKIKEEEAFAHTLSHFWCPHSEEFVQQKLAERAQYDADLETHYENTKPSKTTTHIFIDL